MRSAIGVVALLLALPASLPPTGATDYCDGEPHLAVGGLYVFVDSLFTHFPLGNRVNVYMETNGLAGPQRGGYDPLFGETDGCRHPSPDVLLTGTNWGTEP